MIESTLKASYAEIADNVDNYYLCMRCSSVNSDRTCYNGCGTTFQESKLIINMLKKEWEFCKEFNMKYKNFLNTKIRVR